MSLDIDKSMEDFIMGNKPKLFLILILVVFLAGCQSYTILNENDMDYPSINPMPDGDEAEIRLFYPHKEENVLLEEVRIVNLENKRLEDVVIDELLKGTRQAGLRKIVPNGVKLLSIYTQGSIVYVNFNKAFIKEKTEEVDEVLIIYSIVNSLTSIEDIDKVQILIEGEKRENFNKHKLNEPLGFSHVLLELPYNSPESIAKEYYDAFLTRDYRKMLAMESTRDVNETGYNVYTSYYETKELGLVHYEINNVEIIKYDSEIIFLYELNLYYSDGRINQNNWMEMNLKYEDNKFFITKIKNYEENK